MHSQAIFILYLNTSSDVLQAGYIPLTWGARMSLYLSMMTIFLKIFLFILKNFYILFPTPTLSPYNEASLFLSQAQNRFRNDLL